MLTNREHYSKAARRTWSIMSGHYLIKDPATISTQRVDSHVFSHIRKYVRLSKDHERLNEKMCRRLKEIKERG